MIERVCQHCRSVFQTWPAEIRKGHGKFCSKGCGTSHHFAINRVARFWAKVDRKGPDECWEWTANRDGGGYGVVQWMSRGNKAHRIAMGLTDGDWSSELDVCHTCDNPPCCNPAHLWRGTTLANIRDAMSKGRFKGGAHGERHASAKLTEADVRDIRASKDIQIVLAARYGVRQGVISSVIRRNTWKNVI